jgi:hypothetical protein
MDRSGSLDEIVSCPPWLCTLQKLLPRIRCTTMNWYKNARSDDRSWFLNTKGDYVVKLVQQNPQPWLSLKTQDLKTPYNLQVPKTDGSKNEGSWKEYSTKNEGVQNEGSKKGVRKQEKKGQKKKGKKPEILFPQEPTFSPLGGVQKT